MQRLHESFSVHTKCLISPDQLYIVAGPIDVSFQFCVGIKTLPKRIYYSKNGPVDHHSSDFQLSFCAVAFPISIYIFFFSLVDTEDGRA